jgi:glycosyltransferase involved in cell wall biosynthesis
MDKPTIVLSQVFYPMSIGRYFEAALKRRDDINLITVGPYTGNMIPWNHWMGLPNKYAVPPDIVIPWNYRTQPPPKLPITFIENQLSVTPDLWIQIDAGFNFEGRPTSGKNVIVATDPHVLNYDQQRTYADRFYCMQACYSKPGDIYLPYAYDPIWHAPQEEKRLFDVCLLGLHYPNRNALVNRLRGEKVKVYYDLGPVYDEARQIYNQAPIGINWSSKDDLVARVFELLGMGRLAVVNRVPDLHLFFEDGKDLIVFDTLEEATDKILYYLAHEDELQTIADSGRRRVRPHTWDARIDQILNDEVVYA